MRGRAGCVFSRTGRLRPSYNHPGVPRVRAGQTRSTEPGCLPMKSAIQVFALFVVVVGGIFGLTFFTQFTRTKDVPAADGGSQPVRAELLKQYEKTATWD